MRLHLMKIFILKDDITRMEANSNAGDINVVIDPPNDTMIPVDIIGESSGVHVLQHGILYTYIYIYVSNLHCRFNTCIESSLYMYV